MNAEKIVSALGAITERIQKEKAYLTELDNQIADGDHGINISRGLTAVMAKLTATPATSPADVLKNAGMAFMSTAGGTSGPLYGTLFLYMGKALEEKDDVTIADFLPALRKGIDGISARGRATVGEKTMLDSMYPAVNAMDEAFARGESTDVILASGVKAAWDGVEYTKTIAATKGRASYIGERSIGFQDPGATSFTMMLEELAKAAW